jgi:hypothetical protein
VGCRKILIKASYGAKESPILKRKYYTSYIMMYGYGYLKLDKR